MSGGCPSGAALLVTQVNTVHETVAVVELASKSASRRLRHRAHTHVDNVELHPQAASDSVRMLPFYLGPPEHTSVASLLPHQRSSQRVDVSCVLLDDVLARCGPIELIKIDVEGWEEQVLHGARALLDSCAPNLIVEVNSPAVSAFLLARGYRMFKIGWNELEPISDPAAPLLQQQFNALFTKKTV